MEASVFMGKNYSENLNYMKNTVKVDKSEKLIIEQSGEIFGSVSNQMGRFFMETIIFGQC